MAFREAPPFRNRINTLLEAEQNIESIEMQNHLARYLCVLLSGYIEIVIRETLIEYAKQRCQKTVLNYVSEILKDFQNPKYTKIYELIASFDPSLVSIMDGRILQEEKDAINSIVARRHEIAHGKQAGLSLATLKGFWARVESARRKIETTVLGEPTFTPPQA